MQALLGSTRRAFVVGVGLAFAVLAIAAWSAIDVHAAGALFVRAWHVLAAMVWVGFIAFVNVVQHPAIVAADAQERPVLIRYIAGPSARVFTGAAHATLFTGVLLTVPIGAGVHHRPILLGGIIGGLAMWAIVQFILRPNVARVTGKVPADAAEKLAARSTIGIWARVNLILMFPVTVAMLIAAHAGL